MIKNNILKKLTIEGTTTFLVFLAFSCTHYINNAVYAADSLKIPKRVTEFANKHECVEVHKHTSFKKPFYSYKGYEVYIGHSRLDEDDACPILYKYGLTRFATSDEYMQIIGASSSSSSPTSLGMKLDYIRHYKKFRLH